MQTEDLITIPGLWDFEYRYFAGETASRFFNALKNEGRIFATVCPKCAAKPWKFSHASDLDADEWDAEHAKQVRELSI